MCGGARRRKAGKSALARECGNEGNGAWEEDALTLTATTTLLLMAPCGPLLLACCPTEAFPPVQQAPKWGCWM